MIGGDARGTDVRRARVGIVGTGWWGLEHIRAFSERPDVELVAVVGRSADKVSAHASRVGARAYGDAIQMVERERPDLVSVCLPNQGHFETTLELIRTGTPLLVEKPFVFNLKQADALLAEADSRNLFLAIDFNHRFAIPVRMAREAIDSGRLGQLAFVSWRFGGEGFSDHPDGNLIETQCHGFDMLEYLCGPIVSVTAEMTEFESRGHSTVAVALRFASGAVGSLLGSYDSSYAYPDAHRLEVNGSAGRIVVHDTVRGFEVQAVGSEVREVWEAGYFNDLGRMFSRTLDQHIDAVLAALRSGEPPPIHARAGRRALELAIACVQSFESGRRVGTDPSGLPLSAGRVVS
jgi:myo-inositol 2-dehydrogenase/D-chiro-inositol 1-dehydrogenase